jgi:hypothetical protein
MTAWLRITSRPDETTTADYGHAKRRDAGHRGGDHPEAEPC